MQKFRHCYLKKSYQSLIQYKTTQPFLKEFKNTLKFLAIKNKTKILSTKNIFWNVNVEFLKVLLFMFKDNFVKETTATLLRLRDRYGIRLILHYRKFSQTNIRIKKLVSYH